MVDDAPGIIRGGPKFPSTPTSTPAPGPVSGPVREGTDVARFQAGGGDVQSFTPAFTPSGRGSGGGALSAEDQSLVEELARRESESRARESRAREAARSRAEASALAEISRQEGISSRRISGQLQSQFGEGFEGVIAGVGLQREAERRGRGFSRKESIEFFKERGTSIGELRQERSAFIGTGALAGAIGASLDLSDSLPLKRDVTPSNTKLCHSRFF